MVYRIAPSILAADFARLGEEVASVLHAGADWIHIDVMDNHYVPNLTIGPMICKALRPYAPNAVLDVHLMVEPVDEMIIQATQAGADMITFHPEASRHIDRSLALIRQHGCKAGLAFNPAMPLHYLDYVMDKIDMILLMSVNPGFGGQTFLPSTLPKIAQTKARCDDHQKSTGRRVYIQVDGGIHQGNIAQVAQAGADTFVAGSAIFQSGDYVGSIKKMRDALMMLK